MKSSYLRRLFADRTRLVTFSRTLPVLLSLCGAAHATETIITDDNFADWKMDTNQTWNIKAGDVIEFQTTSDALEVHRVITNGCFDANGGDGDSSLKENGTLRLAENALVQFVDDDEDVSKRIQVGKVEMAAYSTLRLNASMAVTGSTDDETFAFTMGAGARIELGERASEITVVPLLHMGENPVHTASSYTEIRKANGVDCAVITNTLDHDVHLSYVEESGIKMDGVFLRANGMYNLYYEAEMTNAAVQNVTQEKTIEIRNGNSSFNQIDAQTGDVKILNQKADKLELESLRIGDIFSSEHATNRQVAVKKEDGSSSTVSLKGSSELREGCTTLMALTSPDSRLSRPGLSWMQTWSLSPRGIATLPFG